MEPLREEPAATSPEGEHERTDQADSDIEQDMTDPEPFKTMAELEKELADIRQSNHKRKIELSVFKAHHERIRNPEEEAEEAAKAMAESVKLSTRSVRSLRRSVKQSKRGSNRNSNRPTAGGSGGHQWSLVLSATEKVQIGTKEFEQIINSCQKDIKDWDTSLFKMDAQTDWGEHEAENYQKMLNLTMNEMYKYNDPTRVLDGKLPLVFTEQRLKRIHDEKIKAMVGESGTLMLKSSSARAGLRQINLQMAQKEESGEELYTVDFQKLSIQNEQINTELASCNTDLLVLKQKMSKIGIKKEKFASNIRRVTAQNDRLAERIEAVEQHIGKTFRDGDEVEAERCLYDAQVQTYRQRLSEVRVPSVASYINMTVDIDALAEVTPLWERRVDVMGKECEKYKGMWGAKRRMRMGASAFFGRASRKSAGGSSAFGYGESPQKLPRKSKPSFRSINSVAAHPRFSEGSVAGVTEPVNNRRKLPAIR